MDRVENAPLETTFSLTAPRACYLLPDVAEQRFALPNPCATLKKARTGAQHL
jgi:hypothetical protein